MAEYWYSNGQARSNLGYVGFDGTNRFVVSYLFTVPSGGASSVSVYLHGIGSLHGSSGTLGLKIGTSPSQYASAGSGTTPDGTGSLSFSSSLLWNGTITASGLNLPAGQYYATIYVPSNDVFYWSQWVAGADSISTSGSYTPTSSSISSITSSVNTLDSVTIVMTNPSGLTHTAQFKYGSTVLATSGQFTNTLTYQCPRSWFAQNTAVTSMSITVVVTSSAGQTNSGSFMLYADEGMKPSITSITHVAVNEGTSLSGYIASISKAQVTFASVDTSNTAGASIRTYTVDSVSSSSNVVTTGKITQSCTLTCSVTDSRGRVGSTTISIKAKTYVLPTLSNISAIRCDSSGTESTTGTSVRAKATASYSSLDGANSVTINVYVKQNGGSYGSSIGTLTSGTERRFDGVLSSSYTYTVKIEITDLAGGSNYYEIALAYEKWLMKFCGSGYGVGFGMAPDSDYRMQIPSDWKFLCGNSELSNTALKVGSGIVLSTEKLVLVSGVHYGSSYPSNPVEGQVFFYLGT